MHIKSESMIQWIRRGSVRNAAKGTAMCLVNYVP